MAKRKPAISTYFLLITSVSAVAWQAAPSTALSSNNPYRRDFPTTLALSIPTPTPDLDLASGYEPPSVCGYVDYSSLNSYTCAGPNTCLWNSHLNRVGCGNPTSIHYITSCVPYRSLSNCNSSCFADPSIIQCGSDIPHCATHTVGPAGNYSILACQATYPVPDYTVHLNYEGQTTIGHLPRYLGEDNIVTYATRYPTSISAVRAVTSTKFEGEASYVASSSCSTGGGDVSWHHRATDTSGRSRYYEEQVRKEIIFGGTVGGFMVLVALSLGAAFLYAWKRRRKVLQDGKNNNNSEFEMRDEEREQAQGT